MALPRLFLYTLKNVRTGRISKEMALPRLFFIYVEKCPNRTDLLLRLFLELFSALQLLKFPAYSNFCILQIPLLTTSCNCRIAQAVAKVQIFSKSRSAVHSFESVPASPAGRKNQNSRHIFPISIICYKKKCRRCSHELKNYFYNKL